ncbi:hypothetical protein PO124_11165 [Bacillus licheniformis]|nr:hypothetical protein [Bacillus licheniformis]
MDFARNVEGNEQKCAVLQALRRAGGRGTSFRPGGKVSACDDTKRIIIMAAIAACLIYCLPAIKPVKHSHQRKTDFRF